MSVGPVKRQNLPASIASHLRGQILRGELRPGSRLPGHRELAAMYSVSVGSVREGLSMLISTGLVETQARRGTYIVAGQSPRRVDAFSQPLERKAVEELTEARKVIEVELAALAAVRATAEQVEELRRCVDRLAAAAANPYDYPDADVEFHLTLAEAAGNRFLLQAMTDIQALLKQHMELGAEAAIRRFGDLAISVDSHRRLAEAIVAGDPGAAREEAAAIVDRNQKFVLGLYALAGAEATR